MTQQTTIPAGEWLRVNEDVAPFVHPDESYSYGSVLLQADGGRRRWVATDAHRLVVLDAGPTDDRLNVLVSTRLVSAAASLADEAEDDITLSVDGAGPSGPTSSSVGSTFGRVTLPVGSGEFPDWQAVLTASQQSPSAQVVVDRGVLWRMIAEARTSPRGVDLDRISPLFWLQVEPGSFRIRVDWPGVGPSTFSPSCQADGNAHLSVNPRYLAELVAACDPGAVRLTFPSRHGGPLVIDDGDGWTGYLMPINTTVDAARPKTEAVLAEAFGLDDVEPDDDGDYPLPLGTAPLYARLVGGDTHRLQVFAVAVAPVARTEALLAELNDINTAIALARVFWVADQVLFEAELEVSDLDPDLVSAAATRVADLAATYGPLLALAFGAGDDR